MIPLIGIWVDTGIIHRKLYTYMHTVVKYTCVYSSTPPAELSPSSACLLRIRILLKAKLLTYIP